MTNTTLLQTAEEYHIQQVEADYQQFLEYEEPEGPYEIEDFATSFAETLDDYEGNFPYGQLGYSCKVWLGEIDNPVHPHQLVERKATWLKNQSTDHLGLVTEWIEEDNEDTYADTIELICQRVVDHYNLTEFDVVEIAQRCAEIIEWIDTNTPQLAELHAQWNQDMNEDDMYDAFATGVYETLTGLAELNN